MTTALHEQRLQTVCETIRALAPRTVLDLGCGDGDLIVRLARAPGIEHIVGLDTSLTALKRLGERLGALIEPSGPRIDLVHGSMMGIGAVPVRFDCAVLLETIEHLDPARLSDMVRSVFGNLNAKTVIVTTPNADFNVLLGVPSHRFRHPDHRFEWGRERFRRWARHVAARHGYEVGFRDLGGVRIEHGGPSQMALFHRPTDGTVARPSQRPHPV